MSATSGQGGGRSEGVPVVFEVTSQALEVASGVNDLVVTPVTGAEAFRRYSWLFGPDKNKAGNFRGMVVNAKARKIYLISSGGANQALGVASIVMELVKEFSTDGKLNNPNVSSLEKTQRILLNGGFAILRSVTSIVPFTMGAALLALEGYVRIAEFVTGSDSAGKLVVDLQKLRAFIHETHQRQWSGDYWYDVVILPMNELVSGR
jgi:hypothetical protein